MRGQGRSPCPPLFPQQVNEEEEGSAGAQPLLGAGVPPLPFSPIGESSYELDAER